MLSADEKIESIRRLGACMAGSVPAPTIWFLRDLAHLTIRKPIDAETEIGEGSEDDGRK